MLQELFLWGGEYWVIRFPCLVAQAQREIDALI
jgi:hypothetical protein